MPMVIFAQYAPVQPERAVADTNNAVIEGRIKLPSGFSAERNVRITLKNGQSILSTLFSNKHGEFRFDNLSQGVYYVQAEIDDAPFEPVVEKVMLGRGITWELTLELRDKNLIGTGLGSRVVSVAELRQVVPPAAKKEYQLGMKFVSKGNFEQAALHFREAISIYPEYLAARNDLGAQYLKLKQVEEAEKHFQIVLASDPKNFNAKFNMGLVRIERRDYIDAISQLNQAIAIDSTRPVARLWLGIAELEMGDSAAAERELTKALITGGAECVAAHYYLARVYFSRGEVADASRAVQAYLQEAPRGEYVREAKELEKQISKSKN
jgi:Tfp pilus assembly protein PilF